MWEAGEEGSSGRGAREGEQRPGRGRPYLSSREEVATDDAERKQRERDAETRERTAWEQGSERERGRRAKTTTTHVSRTDDLPDDCEPTW